MKQSQTRDCPPVHERRPSIFGAIGHLALRTVSALSLAILASIFLIAGPESIKPVRAQDNAFPTKPLRVVVPYPPGGSTDVTTRSAIEEVTKSLGQPIIIENRPGGGTVVGTQVARNAPADGYTLLFQSAALITNVLALKEPGYQVDDFTLVAVLASSNAVLMAPLKPHLQSLGDLVAYARSTPGKLNYATLGQGTSSHILAYRFGLAAKMDWVDIPYKGAVEASNAVLAGDVDTFIASQFAAHAIQKTGKAKLLAIASKSRVDSLPDVPTFAELGYPEIEDEGAYMIFVRSQTPQPIIAKLRKAFETAVASPEFQARREAQGLSKYAGTLEDYNKTFSASQPRLAREFQALGITPK